MRGASAEITRPLTITMAIPSMSPANEPDRRLVERMARGDEQALAALYDRFGPVLYGTALRIAGERADADEIVLDSFQQAWRDAARFREERGSVAAWLTMICRSRALDLVRSRVRRERAVNRAESAGAGDPPAMGQGPATGGGAEAGERGRIVAAAMAQLAPPQRQAIELAYFEGLSQSEIAERLREPLGTIKTRVRLGMQKLRDALRSYYFEASP
jgi:RNA polymerase sigma-70 factor (ECF subfamily)